ncbi:hypothetical protein [Streptomyces humi]
MSSVTHFGILIGRMPGQTYARTVLGSEDCRFLCAACYELCWGIFRRHGETAWRCSRCTGMRENGQEPGPRSFDTQPPGPLPVSERLRGPGGTWTVTGRSYTEAREHALPQKRPVYVLTRDDGREVTLQPRDMADFHLLTPTFDHITDGRRDELERALSAAGLAWRDNGRHSAPQTLRYTVTDPCGRRWVISPAASNEIEPSQPSSLWRATRPAPYHAGPLLSAVSLTHYVRRAAP